MLHAVCSERIPFVRILGVSAALSAFFVPGDLDLAPLTLTFEFWQDFCTLHLTAKFHHPTLNRWEMIVLTNRQTDTAENIHLAPLCYAGG